jgi:hypothetical protein
MSSNRFCGKSMMVLLSVVMIAFFAGCATTSAPPPSEVSYDGLQLVPNSKADIAYIDPDADFSIYKRIMLMPVEVSFDKRWQRDYNSSSVSMIPSSEWKRIRRDVSDLFAAVFKEVLEEEGGYTIVDEPAEDVLLIVPALSNLRASALDLNTPGRRTVYVAQANEQHGTLSLEAFDSLTGDILARVIHSQAVRQYGGWEYSRVTRVENVQLARQMFRKWAIGLRDSLDEFQGK